MNGTCFNRGGWKTPFGEDQFTQGWGWGAAGRGNSVGRSPEVGVGFVSLKT